MSRSRRATVIAATISLGGVLLAQSAPAAATPPPTAAGYWTPERMASATPRDLVVDQRGRGYLRHRDGSLEPHGHSDGQLFTTTPAETGRPVPNAKPGGGGGDTAGPSVSNPVPAAGATIGASATFSATVTDPSGVRSVTAVIVLPGGTTQSFAMPAVGGGVYRTDISGFTDGSWGWYVQARDNVKGAGNLTTSPTNGFTVSTGSGGGGGGGGGSKTPVANARWTGAGDVQTAAGRIYFEMPTNPQKTRWAAYVCSGSVATDAIDGRSMIVTAAHCVYDDANKAFARNVLFIPNQDATTGTGTDTNCGNDPLGCWTPTFGVVDTDWTTRTFPDNIPWDYGFYVVNDTGAHSGNGASGALDAIAHHLDVSFAAPTPGAFTHALGYSYSEDPHFMYCAENLGVDSGTADWWLGQCGLSGGASGGPWMQSEGAGPIMSVNSWGYTNQPGMAGPNLDTSSAECVFNAARASGFNVSNRGFSPAAC